MKSRFDTRIYSEYFGDYSLRICRHPSRSKNGDVITNECRKCDKHRSETGGISKCPFCGGQAGLSHDYVEKYYIRCRKCGIHTDSSDDIDVLLKTWNSRKKKG